MELNTDLTEKSMKKYLSALNKITTGLVELGIIKQSLEEIKANLKLDGPAFTLNLGNFDSGEKNIYVEIKKYEATETGINEDTIKVNIIQTNYFFVCRQMLGHKKALHHLHLTLTLRVLQHIYL